MDVNLAALVKAMRDAQRTYFKTRSTDALEMSKRLEREVDAIVASILSPQESLFNLPPGGRVQSPPPCPRTADFDGPGYVPERDKERLNSQLQSIHALMKDGLWRTLADISKTTKAPEASVSAALRALRRPKFGGYNVEREYVKDGLHRYRVTTPFKATA